MLLDKIFNKYLREDDFIRLSSEKLKKYGFNHENTIAGVCLCRDELCQSVLCKIEEHWGKIFNFSSFAGVYTSGEIGIEVFISHAPDTGKDRRCIFFVFSHIGVDEKGNLGFCQRKGMENSSACGALILFHNELLNSNKKIQAENPEFTLLKQKLSKKISGKTPDILELTQLALSVTCEDIENTMEEFVQSERIIYAIISGIQVHYLDKNYIVPKNSFVIMNNEKIILEL